MRRVAMLLWWLLLLPGLAWAADPATVEVLHADLLNGDSVFEYSATLDTGQRVPVRTAVSPDERFLTGDRVLAHPPAKGAKGGAWTIEPLQQQRGPGVAAALVSGVQKTVVLLVNYSNKPNVATDAQAQSTAQYLRQFFLEQSYGALTLEVDIAPRITIALPSGGCAYSTISSQADAAAAAAGVNLGQYMHRIYSFPASPCNWSGLGTVGGNPSRMWYNGAFTYYPLASHEMGHNVGLYHSHRLECGMGPAWGPLGSGCSNVEYGDTHDVMGSGQAARFNAAQTTRLGWLTPRSPAPGTYDLPALESTADALKVARGSDTLWIEHRRNLGVLLHAQIGSSSSNGIYLLNAGGQSAPVLPAGRTWVDVNGAAGSVRVNSSTSLGASVTLSGGSTTPPIDPPPIQPPVTGGADVTKTFKKTSTGNQELVNGQWVAVAEFAVDVVPYQCLRLTGGSSVLRIENLTTGALLKKTSIANPAMNTQFTLRCQMTPTVVNLYIDAVKKLSLTR